jgi:hypothetical protein
VLWRGGIAVGGVGSCLGVVCAPSGMVVGGGMLRDISVVRDEEGRSPPVRPGSPGMVPAV